MRFRAGILVLGTVLFTLSAMPAFADMLPSFPDRSAPETTPLLLVGLFCAVAVSGTSLLLLQRIRRARGAVDTEVAELTPPTGDARDDSGFDVED